MAKFGNKSLNILHNAHPELRLVLNEAIKYFDFSVIESVRTQEQHEENVRNGKSKTTWEKSKHRAVLDNEGRMTSFAVDITPYPDPYRNNERFILMAGFILSIARKFYEQGKMCHRVRWGGNWSMNDDPKYDSFFDGGHFELVD
jgi:hypothetical protein